MEPKALSKWSVSHFSLSLLQLFTEVVEIGVFFLFGAGRLALHRSQPRAAIRYYTSALRSQVQYRNLHHVSFWEVAVARLALWELGEGRHELEGEKTQDEKAEEQVEPLKDDITGSAGCWRLLVSEATVRVLFWAVHSCD